MNISVIPALAKECVLPEKLELRTPIDFIHSYKEGLEDLIARITAPNKIIKPKEVEKNISLNASEKVAGELRKFLAKHPEKIAKLNAKKFEELVADILSTNFGLDVELSNRSKDGGIDIVALGGRNANDTPILIQCKRYSRHRRVGVEVVRSLFGASILHDVGQSILVTTSYFSRSAIKEAEKITGVSRDRWKLDLVDMERLVSWLNMSPELGPDITMPVKQMRDRLAILVDKKFANSLTIIEKAEYKRLEEALDRADSVFYEPLIKKLRQERDRLINKQSKQNKKD